MAAGLCVFCLVCLGKPIVAKTDSGNASNKATATVQFAIHIPETLSMRIAGPDRSNRHLAEGNSSDRLSGKTNENEQTIDIDILGNVIPGGTMALTADNAVPQLDGRIKRNPRSLVTWTAKGFFPAESRRGKKSDSGSVGNPTSHTFTFSDKHHLEPGPIDQQIIYTISAP